MKEGIEKEVNRSGGGNNHCIKPSGRDFVIDVSKGIGILFVVAMHSGLGFLPGVDMEFFFLISGFFLPRSNRYAFNEAVMKRTCSLLIPTFEYAALFGFLAYFIARLSVVNFPHWNFFFWLTPDKIFWDSLIYMPFQPWAGNLWFLTTLWFGTVIWLLLRPLFEIWYNETLLNKLVMIFLLFFLYYSCLYGPSITNQKAVGCLDRAIYAFVFMGFGFLLYPYKDEILHGNLRGLVVVLALVAILFKYKYWNHWPSFSVRDMNFDLHVRPFWLVVSISGICLYFFISIVVSKLDCISTLVSWFGKKSLHIMALHPLGLDIYRWSVKSLDWRGTSLGMFLFGLCFSIICILFWDKYLTKISIFLSVPKID